MASKAVAYSSLALRFIVLLTLAGSIAVMATNSYRRIDGAKFSFKDVITYRYVIACAMIAFVYTAIQIPFAIYRLCTDKDKGCAQNFDFYADKIMSFLLATAVGAGFAFTYEWVTYGFERYFNFIFFDNALAEDFEEVRPRLETFLGKAYFATALLFLGFICMAILSILSSTRRHGAATGGGKHGGYFYFF